jgi:hypothetical protein
MTEKLEALRIKLQAKVNDGVNRMESVQSSISSETARVEGAVRGKLDEAKASCHSAKQKVVDATNRLKLLAEEKELENDAEILAWKAGREVIKLEKRAERAENYAETSIEIALCAIAEAEEAVLEALAARMDVDAVL